MIQNSEQIMQYDQTVQEIQRQNLVVDQSLEILKAQLQQIQGGATAQVQGEVTQKVSTDGNNQVDQQAVVATEQQDPTPEQSNSAVVPQQTQRSENQVNGNGATNAVFQNQFAEISQMQAAQQQQIYQQMQQE